MIADWQLDRYAFDAWMNADGEYNRGQRERVKRVLPIVLNECVTDKQRTYIIDYYVNRMNLRQIADQYNVNISTVSRTIHRGLANMHKYMRFVSPQFANVQLNSRSLSNR